ncbi:hypothetical protein Gohar_007151, partial [Gossypium harknessii]|nr:hypothetical protein [Gossypium harknessii]
MQSNTRAAASGGVVWDHTELWLCEYSRLIGRCSTSNAEFWVMGLRKVKFVHVFREGNRVVNGMASLAFNRALQLHVFAAPPNGILQ